MFDDVFRWEKASWTDHKSIDEIFMRDVEILDIYSFASLITCGFLLQYPRRVSIINAKVTGAETLAFNYSGAENYLVSSQQVFVMPCLTSHLLRNLQYLDLSDNLLTDITLMETLCNGDSPLKDLRVLNISGNALKVLSQDTTENLLDLHHCPSVVQALSTTSRLVAKLSRLTHLDVSRNRYSSMPRRCSWPPGLRYLNMSGIRIPSISPCLPAGLEVLAVPASVSGPHDRLIRAALCAGAGPEQQ